MITYPGIFFMNKVQVFWAMIWRGGSGGGAQRAKIAEKVHKPPLGFSVVNVEVNGFNASTWGP